MKLKILQDSTRNSRITGYVEEVLSETCSSFGHRLNVGYGLIGKASSDKYGVPLAQDVVDDCAEYDGTLVLTADEALTDELSDAMELPVLISEHTDAPSGEDRHGVKNAIAVVQSLDEKTINEAARAVRNFALVKGIGFTVVRTNGKSAEVWKNAFLSASLLNGSNQLSEASAPGAIRQMIREPGGYGMIVLPPSAGAIFGAAAEELSRSPLPERKMYAVSGGVYFCMSGDTGKSICADILSAVLSSADFLEFSCHLFKEAECIRTGVYNVLHGEEGLSVPDEEADIMVERICSQISLAGQLTGRA